MPKPHAVSANGAGARSILLFQVKAYRNICVRKHKMDLSDLPEDVSHLSDVELQTLVTLLRDMAHLPPE